LETIAVDYTRSGALKHAFGVPVGRRGQERESRFSPPEAEPP
jgi:hypothetical protein